MTPMLGESFEMCIACSPTIINAFWKSEEEQFWFLLDACNIPDFLEDTTGLLQKLKDIKLDDIEDFMECEDEEFKEEY